MGISQLDSLVQQVAIYFSEDGSLPDNIEFDTDYEQIIVILLHREHMGRMKVFYCAEPHKWIPEHGGVSSRGVSLSPDMPWSEVNGPNISIFQFYEWAYHTTGKFTHEDVFAATAFKSLPSSVSLKSYLWTATNVYSIRASLGYRNEHSYLGAMVSSRMPRPGEDWTRGNDLHDGLFNLNTWNDIVFDILGCELQNVRTKTKFGYDDDCYHVLRQDRHGSIQPFHP